MITRQLGRSGPVVSALGLGCMAMSDLYGPADRGESLATLDAALEAGITLLDTADAYALDDHDLGHNERLIADALAGLGRPVEIVSKGGLVRPGGAWRADGRALHLAAAARASRDRLAVQAIDLYLLHAVDPRTPLATSVRALARLRDDGVVRRIGLSNVGLPQLEVALAITSIDAIEVELSPWRLDALRGGLVAACAARGIRVLAHRPLGGELRAFRLRRARLRNAADDLAGERGAHLDPVAGLDPVAADEGLALERGRRHAESLESARGAGRSLRAERWGGDRVPGRRGRRAGPAARRRPPPGRA